MTIQLAYRQIVARLYEVYDNREAANIADMLLENVTGQRKIDRIMHKDLPLTKPQEITIETYTRQLEQHRPVQYVLNEAWFANLQLYVDEYVLIPRPETEELVEWIVRDIRLQPRRPDKICMLDIGTGSGCIPIALQKQLPAHLITAIDVSEDALEVAKKNATRHQVEVEFLQLNFLNETERNKLEKFDIIISNPPYIRQSEKATMATNVVNYEPSTALFVPDNNALIFYDAIAEFAKEHLAQNGNIYVEINEGLGQQVIDIFNSSGFKKTDTKKDMQGKDRMVRAGKRESEVRS